MTQRGVFVGTSKFAVFVDLENAGAKESMLQNIIEKVKIRGDILLGKVYGYTDRYSNLKETLLSNTFSVVPSLRYGKNQKNSLDIQLVIDAMEVAYTNPLIDSFCIVSGDSDYMPLVGKLKSSGIFIKACSEFIFLESVVAKAPAEPKSKDQTGGDVGELAATVESILEDQDEDQMYASELKDALMRLRPDFNERNYGCATFGKLMTALTGQSKRLRAWTEDSSLIVGLSAPADAPQAKLDKSNWIQAFESCLSRFKKEGFERINPSILKADIQEKYPDFDEKTLGFKRFSDVMKKLEKEGLLVIEMDGAHTMLLKIN